MDCVEIREQMYSYLDGELTVWRRRAVYRHLEHCSPCSEGYALRVTVRRVVAERSSDPMPPDVRTRILGRLASETPVD